MQASTLNDLNEWGKPLAAIVMYTFDLCLISSSTDADQNCYFQLNKVNLKSSCCEWERGEIEESGEFRNGQSDKGLIIAPAEVPVTPNAELCCGRSVLVRDSLLSDFLIIVRFAGVAGA